MAKNLLAIAVMGAYIAVSAWVVRREAESYRRSLRLPATAPPVTSTATPAKAMDFEAASEGPTTDPSAAIAALPVPDHVPEAPRSPALPEPESKPAPDANPAPPAEVKVEFDWKSPAVTKVWDVDRMTIEDEERLGLAMRELILRFNPALDDGPWQARVEEAAEPLLKQVRRKDVEYRFTILDSQGVNCFSTPGGFIYLSRGLFNLIGEDEDYALQFVVGHEIAHVDFGHAIGCLRSADLEAIAMGTLTKLYFVVLPYSYSEKQDGQADSWVADQMRNLGRSRHQILSFLRKFEGFARGHGFENKPKRPDPQAPVGEPIEYHMSAHVIPRHRLKELQKQLASASSPPR